MAAGEMTREEFIQFLTKYMVLCAAHSVNGAVHYNWMDYRHIVN